MDIFLVLKNIKASFAIIMEDKQYSCSDQAGSNQDLKSVKTSVTSLAPCPDAYEKLIQDLEAACRKHIRIE